MENNGRSKQKTDPQRAALARKSTQCGTEKGSGNNPLDIGAAVRVSRLDTLKACRTELGKLYRETRKRSGLYPDALTAKRLADVLAGVRNAIELEDFEKRLQQSEEQMPGR